MSAFVYKGFRQEEVEFHFNPAVAVPDLPWWAKEKNRKSVV